MQSLEFGRSINNVLSNITFSFSGHTFPGNTTCLVFNPIMVEGYAALFSCTAVVQASDSMTASM